MEDFNTSLLILSSTFVIPLLNEGLSQLHPLLPILCYSLPGYSNKFFNLVPPSCIFLLCLLIYGGQSVSLFVHLLLFILAACPAHLYKKKRSRKRPDTRWKDEIEKFAGIACQRIGQNRQLWKESGKAFVQQWTYNG